METLITAIECPRSGAQCSTGEVVAIFVGMALIVILGIWFGR